MHKGIELPEKFHPENEDWRWRALTQPDCEEFAQWFTKNITPNVKSAASNSGAPKP